jgi:hypothetical protein
VTDICAPFVRRSIPYSGAAPTVTTIFDASFNESSIASGTDQTALPRDEKGIGDPRPGAGKGRSNFCITL